VIPKLLAVCLLIASFPAAETLDGLPPVVPDANNDRSSIPEVYLWDLPALYESDDAWAESFSATEKELAGLKTLHRELGAPSTLAAYMETYFRLEVAANRLSLYANLQRDGDTTNQEFIARHQKSLELTNRMMEEGSALRQAVLGYDLEKLEAAYVEVPGLLEYRPWIDSLMRRADRMLDAEAERVLALAGDNLWAAIDLNELPSPLETAFGSLISELPLPKIADQSGDEVQLTFANYGRLRGSEERRARRNTVAGMFATLRGFENTFAATLAGQVEFNVFLARARNYDTALEAYLDKDDLEPAVYTNLIRTVREHVPALHHYIELRKKAMNLDEVHLYDLYVPLVAGVESELDYAEGGKMILESLTPLGDDYGRRLAEVVDPRNGMIDVYPARTKDSGAFSAAVYGVNPYIKMNFQNSYNDVSTLAHELGHALHTMLSMEHQSYLTSRYSMFIAEIASTCNQVLLSKYMVANATSDAERAWYLSELLETIRGTIYRQTLFAEFELRAHELAEAGEPITAERLNSIYEQLLVDYYGPGYTIDANDPVEWAYIPHFYYKYYVFTYATGLASGIAIAERVASGDPAARDAYLEMLSSGNSKPPLELLRGAGVDLTEPDAISAALELFERTVIELEELLGR
jgi:oligoendopeptidase F